MGERARKRTGHREKTEGRGINLSHGSHTIASCTINHKGGGERKNKIKEKKGACRVASTVETHRPLPVRGYIMRVAYSPENERALLIPQPAMLPVASYPFLSSIT